MKILVACEFSGVVRDAFLKLNKISPAYNITHYVTSCDFLPTEGFGPHYQGDVRNILDYYYEYFSLKKRWHKWDMILAFPPCNHLAVSGARYFKEKRKDGRQQQAIDFFMLFANHPCPKIAIENPVGIMSTVWRKPDQIIQPWMFGHGENKKTCLWLKGLPLLKPTNIVEGREQRIWKMPPSPNRARERSRTYQGVAEAMAKQWG